MDSQPGVTPTPVKLTWYQHAWTALPLVLIFLGGAVGGAIGGAAWAANHQVFRRTRDPVLRYVFTGLTSGGARATRAVEVRGQS